MRRRKERRYPELVGPRSRAQLLGGRWSDETLILVSQLARAKARQESLLLSMTLAVGFTDRLCNRRAVALSLLSSPCKLTVHFSFSSQKKKCCGQFAAASFHPCTHSAARGQDASLEWCRNQATGVRSVGADCQCAVDPRAVVWKGLELPVENQVIKVGTPLARVCQFISSRSRRNTNPSSAGCVVCVVDLGALCRDVVEDICQCGTRYDAHRF